MGGVGVKIESQSKEVGCTRQDVAPVTYAGELHIWSSSLLYVSPNNPRDAEVQKRQTISLACWQGSYQEVVAIGEISQILKWGAAANSRMWCSVVLRDGNVREFLHVLKWDVQAGCGLFGMVPPTIVR